MSVDVVVVFFFQAEDGIRDLVRSRGLGDVYKRQDQVAHVKEVGYGLWAEGKNFSDELMGKLNMLLNAVSYTHLTLPTSDLV